MRPSSSGALSFVGCLLWGVAAFLIASFARGERGAWTIVVAAVAIAAGIFFFLRDFAAARARAKARLTRERRESAREERAE